MYARFFLSCIAALLVFMTPRYGLSDPVDGSSAGSFTNPEPDTAVVDGVGTGSFSWGVPYDSGDEASNISFFGESFATDYEQPFILGTLSSFNGTIFSGTGAEEVDLNIAVQLTTPTGEVNTSRTISILNTSNVGVPEEDADSIFLPDSYADDYAFIVDGVTYTLDILGFGDVDESGSLTVQDKKWNVFEDETSTVNLIGRVTKSTCIASSSEPLIFPLPSAPEDNPIIPFVCKLTSPHGLLGTIFEDEEGNRYDLYCESRKIPFFYEFALDYVPADGEGTKQLGRCPITRGRNSFTAFYTNDGSSEKADCVLWTKWQSKEPNKPGEPGYSESKDSFEWKVYLFFPQTGKQIFRHFESKDGPGGLYADNVIKEAAGDALEILKFNPDPDSNEGVMVMEYYPICDMDRDDDCDAVDRAIFERVLGQCIDGDNYNELADANADGCITSGDREMLFPVSDVQNEPPQVWIDVDEQHVCTSHEGAAVELRVLFAYDPEGDPLTYTWIGPFGVLTGATVAASVPGGTHTISLTVDDGKGGIAHEEVEVTVEDTSPPELNLTVSPDELWPPNHKMVPIEATVTATDVCDENPDVVLTSVESNEPDNGKGDGNTVNDIQGADIGTYDLDFELRAERSGKGSGRVYTITYEAIDVAGNTATAEAAVTVPHNQ